MAAQTYHQRIREEKRLGCVRAARALFLAQGYGRTSLAEVARAAGLSTATLFKRYPSKAALFAAVVEDVCQAEAPTDRQPPRDLAGRLNAIGKAYARRLAEPGMADFHRLIIAEAAHFPDLGGVLAERLDGPALADVEAVLRASGLHEGAEATARAFLAVIAGEVLWPALVQPGRPLQAGALDGAVSRAVSMLLAVTAPAAAAVPAVEAERGPAAPRPAVVHPRRPTAARREAPRHEETLSLFAFD